MESSQNGVKIVYKTVMPNIFFPSGNWPVFVPRFLSDAPSESRESAHSGLRGFPDAAVGGRATVSLLYHLARGTPVKLCFAVSSDEVMQHNMASCDRAQRGK